MESASQPQHKGMKASIYLLPNLITASSLFLGFLAMKFAVEGRMATSPTEHFVWAAYCILGASVADGLDGSVARLTRTQSQFGVQLDSLCDLVSFGVAPGFLVFQMTLHQTPRIGFALCFLYALCGALRLARFNVMSSKGKASGNFTGIPIPMAAIPLCVCVLAYHDIQVWALEGNAFSWMVASASWIVQDKNLNIVFGGILFLLSLGMISTFEYVSTKNIKLPRKKPFRVLALVLVCLVMLFTLEFTVTLSILMLIYCLHGPVMWLFLKRDNAALEEEVFATAEDDEDGEK
jgi:CDP-diacylglycerol---serine O-phosphatidyltransferase